MIETRGFQETGRKGTGKREKGRKGNRKEKKKQLGNLISGPEDAPVPRMRSMPNLSVLADTEVRGGDHDHENEYQDPHGHHDVDPSYIYKWVEEHEGESCISQCEALQAMNNNPHFSSIFCYDTATHGWSPSNPTWEVRMEVRCQEGHWANKMKGFRRRRDVNGTDEDGADRGGNHGGGGHGGGGGGNKGGDDGIQAYGNDGNEWVYKPRWFYCDGE